MSAAKAAIVPRNCSPRPPSVADAGGRGEASHSSILVAVSTLMRLPVIRATMSATRRQCAGSRLA
jgi:hypothetical protein